MKQVFHEDFLGEDIPRILEEIGDSAFSEFFKCLDKTFAEVERYAADYHVVYRCDFQTDEFIILGVGRPMPGHPDDIYSILAARSPI